jgi:hypothetical protein
MRDNVHDLEIAQCAHRKINMLFNNKWTHGTRHPLNALYVLSTDLNLPQPSCPKY